MTPCDFVFIGDEIEEDENEDELKLKIHHTWLALDEEDSYQSFPMLFSIVLDMVMWFCELDLF